MFMVDAGLASVCARVFVCVCVCVRFVRVLRPVYQVIVGLTGIDGISPLTPNIGLVPLTLNYPPLSPPLSSLLPWFIDLRSGCASPRADWRGAN